MKRFLFCPDCRERLSELLSVLRAGEPDLVRATAIFQEVFSCKLETVLGTIGIDRIIEMLTQLTMPDTTKALVNLSTGDVNKNPTLLITGVDLKTAVARLAPVN